MPKYSSQPTPAAEYITSQVTGCTSRPEAYSMVCPCCHSWMQKGMTPQMLSAPTVTAAGLSGSRSTIRATRVGIMPTTPSTVVGMTRAPSGSSSTATASRLP
ncbi:MAG: hypothetical protein PW843_07245 [Azospirillaceae bacterium]|nr:hypothetical protein [Azospirillaceae bacterium]